MFYAILRESPPVFAVQPNEQLYVQSASALIERLERHFLHAIAIVAWDQVGQFESCGYPVTEEAATDEDLQWREFELPAEPDVPF